jgi:hypothetical protein
VPDNPFNPKAKIKKGKQNEQMAMFEPRNDVVHIPMDYERVSFYREKEETYNREIGRLS